MPETIDRNAVTSALAERLREHYGSRLWGVYSLPASPYPDGGSESICVVAVLEENPEGFEALDHTADLSYEVDAGHHYAVLSHIYPVGREEFEHGNGFPATRARTEGRRL